MGCCAAEQVARLEFYPVDRVVEEPDCWRCWLRMSNDVRCQKLWLRWICVCEVQALEMQTRMETARKEARAEARREWEEELEERSAEERARVVAGV